MSGTMMDNFRENKTVRSILVIEYFECFSFEAKILAEN